ncbi:PREDICTED: probable G-protein coupled receptor Mth-like 11 [Drosophila arizonae]|uniref:Probable G-protein coupled receptor Mth-like 11 n=1 Tax=Drosophila arizonae TaxID=7263 RepID=A0ABM1NP15_DROAR|nr:PREDICTED: probable G-protein coupled receptor Mth-like 11 [Drosophila arizonae]
MIFVLIVLSVIISEILGDIPGCDYFDTIDLSNSTQLWDGSYVFKNMKIPNLDPYTNRDEQWNGQLYRKFDGRDFGKQHYCMQPKKSKDGRYRILPHQCNKLQDNTDAYTQIVSIFFMIMLIIVYMLLSNLKSIHGKCCTCYFSCLTAFMMTFNNIGVGQKVRFVRYIIVWSAAAVLVLVTFLFDYLHEIMGIPNNLKPGISLYICWINTFDWSAMIYYYGPMLLLLLFNTTIFIKTTNRIVVQN